MKNNDNLQPQIILDQDDNLRKSYPRRPKTQVGGFMTQRSNSIAKSMSKERVDSLVNKRSQSKLSESNSFKTSNPSQNKRILRASFNTIDK